MNKPLGTFGTESNNKDIAPDISHMFAVCLRGKSGVDLPMRIAERLAKLRLEDATASVWTPRKGSLGSLCCGRQGSCSGCAFYFRISSVLHPQMRESRVFFPFFFFSS